MMKSLFAIVVCIFLSALMHEAIGRQIDTNKLRLNSVIHACAELDITFDSIFQIEARVKNTNVEILESSGFSDDVLFLKITVYDPFLLRDAAYASTLSIQELNRYFSLSSTYRISIADSILRIKYHITDTTSNPTIVKRFKLEKEPLGQRVYLLLYLPNYRFFCLKKRNTYEPMSKGLKSLFVNCELTDPHASALINQAYKFGHLRNNLIMSDELKSYLMVEEIGLGFLNR